MPGGLNSPVRAFKSVGRSPLFIEKASGDKIIDADGNEFIDYVCSWGPDIFGHAEPHIINAVKTACENGLTFGACHEGEIVLAEKIKKHFPSMELLRLVNSGTESVMSAVRSARGYTKRDIIIKFEGCYHDHSDGLLVKGGSGLLTNSIPDSAGVPPGFAENTLLVKYNDIDSVKNLFDKFGDDIAAVIVEPCAANMGVVPPKKGFLEYLREITKQYDSVLIFDEVITGFRLSAGGVQEYYKVIPDMTCLGNIVGGGHVHLTSRQSIEIPFVKLDDIDAVKSSLAEENVEPGVCGPRVRTITACQGNAICPSGCIDTYALAKELDDRYFPRELPHKFKFGITGCQNNFLKAEENDLGIKGA